MPRVAIVGASGLVGQSLIDQLNSLYIQCEYVLFGKNSIGKKVEICHKTYITQDIDSIMSFELDYCIFMSTNAVADSYIPQLVNSGVVCIDNSSRYRLDDNVPLVVNSINGHKISSSALIANPNCTTIQLAITLSTLIPLGLHRVVCSTYQAVSGGGREAMNDMVNHCSYGSLSSLAHPIFDNVIPQIDLFDSNGITREEYKVINETRKILSMPNLAISCMAVRIPISTGHSISANIELAQDYTVQEIKEALSTNPNIIIRDDTTHNIYPMPIIARNTPYVYVGRITKDPCRPTCFNCFIVADNLIRGASINAIEILLQHISNQHNINEPS